jgi:hypothetical protein
MLAGHDGIFIPFGNNTPDWILWIARIFPVKHFADGMQAGFLGTAFHWTDVLVVAACWPCASSAGSPGGADRHPGGWAPSAVRRERTGGSSRLGITDRHVAV